MIKTLDSYRFFAFFVVFLFHLELFNGGYLGVQAFFVLSGYLLTPILVDMKAALPLKRYMVSFYGRRMLRIFPVYYVYIFFGGMIAFTAISILHKDHLSELVIFNEQLPYAITYTYNFFHASGLYQHTPLLTHFWSLAVEEQFYLVWPLFVWLCPRNKLKLYLCVIIVSGPLIRLLEYSVFHYSHMAWLIDDPNLAVYVLPFSHFDAFATGGLLSLMKQTKWKHAAWIMTVVALTVGIGSQYVVKGYIHWRALGYTTFMRGEWKCVWGYSIVNVTFGCILRAVQSNEYLPHLFSAPVFQYLGVISYGLYVYHYPIIWYFNNTYSHTLNRLSIYMLAFITTILVSAMSYELFEKRFILLKDKWFRKE